MPIGSASGAPAGSFQLPGGYAAPAVVLIDSSGNEVSGDTTGISLAAQSTLNTNGAVVDLGRVVSNPVQQVVASAGVSAGQVALQGSLDGTNWYTVSAGSALGAPGVTVNVAATPGSTPARYLRSTITTGITGGTVTTTLGGA